MSEVRMLAERAGIVVELADLGDWGAATLVSEYDPVGPAIRVNVRAIERYRSACGSLSSCDVRELIDFAVAHELYHHREATGEIAVERDRGRRESAADAYAHALVPVGPRLADFVKAARS